MSGVDVERAKRVVAVVKERGRFKAEDAAQLAEAGIPIYSYVSREDVEAGRVLAVPPRVLEIIGLTGGGSRLKPRTDARLYLPPRKLRLSRQVAG